MERLELYKTMLEMANEDDELSNLIQNQVDAMFQALEDKIAEVKAIYTPKKAAESKTFCFGTSTTE